MFRYRFPSHTTRIPTVCRLINQDSRFLKPILCSMFTEAKLPDGVRGGSQIAAQVCHRTTWLCTLRDPGFYRRLG